MITYTVKAGETNFRPLERLLPYWSPAGFSLIATIHPGAWASLEEFGGDQDRADWQKLKGLSSFFSGNNKETAYIAFNYDDEPGFYRAVGYTNFPGSAWVAGKPVRFKEGEPLYAQADFWRGRVRYQLSSAYGNESYYHDFLKRKPLLAREAGTYAGGANNSPGPHGGKAFKDMSIDVSFKVF